MTTAARTIPHTAMIRTTILTRPPNVDVKNAETYDTVAELIDDEVSVGRGNKCCGGVGGGGTSVC